MSERSELEQAAHDHARETAGVDEVKAYLAGAARVMDKLTGEEAETVVMKWLHKNYLESYDKCSSSFHRILVRDLLEELKTR